MFSPTSSRSSGVRSLHRGDDEEISAFACEAEETRTRTSRQCAHSAAMDSAESVKFLAASSSTYGTSLPAAAPQLPSLPVGAMPSAKRDHRKSKKRREGPPAVAQEQEAHVERTLDSQGTQFITEKGCVVTFCEACGRVASKCSCASCLLAPA
jgi:hypothetical protein